MQIPDILVTKIREGKATLLLGSGASKGAIDSKGNSPPDGKELGNMLSDKFLGAKLKELPLNQIAECAANESNLAEVQECIKDIFEDFEPASFHLKISSFLWRGIATTNYDLILEKAYRKAENPVQNLVPFIEDGDRVDTRMRDEKNLMFLKLHGCITRINNPQCPLILTTDQYITHRSGRSRIYSHLTDWAYEHPIVFIGQSLQDSDLREIILFLDNELENRRPMFYMVVSEVDDILKRYWESRRITVLKGTLEDFLSNLDSSISSPFRGIQIAQPLSMPIFERFIRKADDLSVNCQEFLQKNIEYVKVATSSEKINPPDFYKGFNFGWSAVEDNLDVRRKLTEIILLEKFLINEPEHQPGIELILINGHAGSGKSVLLRRLAWDAAHDYDKLCIFLRPRGVINTSAIKELIDFCDERIYLFIDNAGDHVRELLHLANNIKQHGNKLTVILTERTNEWNMTCELLEPFISEAYNLKYLSMKEVDSLLALLEKHRALGTLKNATYEQKKEAFAEMAGRQLLVALHEATLGKPFEEIVLDEFNNILPIEAQRIYLTICVLNRLGVPVRAGIVSRIHKVAFTDFKKHFFAPLECIVRAVYNEVIRDYEYCTRHRHIAEMVFDQVLQDQNERFDIYIKCLSALNIDYSADRRAFRYMVNAKTLIELFPDPAMIQTIYKRAQEIAGEDAFLLQQLALYEMNRTNGNLTKADEYLTRASQLATYDITIKHSKAELSLRFAQIARTPLEKERCLQDASAIAISVRDAKTGNSYAFHTLVKVGLMRLKDFLSQDQAEQIPAHFEEIVKSAENNLFDGLQQFPTDSHLLAAESELASLLVDSKRSISALEKAFSVNPRNTFIALRLASCCQKSDEEKGIEKAKEVLKKAIDANHADKRLHYAYAKILLSSKDATDDQLLYYLKRSFTKGDANYEAQLLYGRQLFIMGDNSAKDFFKNLGAVHMNPALRHELRYPLDQEYHGIIARLESTYCFIVADGINDWIFGYQDNIDSKIRSKLRSNMRVRFKIAFTMRGPSASEICFE